MSEGLETAWALKPGLNEGGERDIQLRPLTISQPVAVQGRLHTHISARRRHTWAEFTYSRFGIISAGKETTEAAKSSPKRTN